MKKFLLISPKNRTVYNFRGDLVKKIISAGYEVLVTGPDLTDVDKIRALGARFVEIPMNKTGTSVFGDLKYCYRLFRLFRAEKPDTTLGYTVKPVVYGAIAAKLAGVKSINSMVTGGGYTFTAKTAKAKLLGLIVRTLYKIGFLCTDSVIFQNSDDLNEFCARRLTKKEKSYVVNGSGVNTERFTPAPYPNNVSFFMLSRLLKSKGVSEYLQAAENVKREYPQVKFYLLGKFEYNMQDAIEERIVRKYIDDGIIELFPETTDVRPYYEMSSVYVLPSYREGTPRTVLEAMAMARAVITTDTNGCRETVKDGVNGYLVPVADVAALTEAMKKFLKNPEKIETMGAESYRYCKEKFDVERVNEDMLNILQIQHKERTLNMSLYEKIVNREEKISLVGLGYVGMPIAVAFAKKVDVIGYDLNEKKIALYKSGIDPTNEVGDEVIKNTTVEFTSDESKLKEAKFHIVAVPTPVNDDHTPDLTPVEGASKIVGRNLTPGSIVVYESTVYPGVTEDVCIPILEQESGLKCGVDFKIGYSPERINPGDKVHRLETIVKIVSGMDDESLDEIAKVYELVVEAGVHRASCIKVAEAAKVIENSQRDINIAFMNELSIIFNKMGIDTKSVLEAAGTKWNFLKFFPGLVGGHCIGVDPYYLTYKAEMLGYHSQVILSGRRINDDMGKYVAENCVKNLIKAEKSVKNAKVAILGFTFKENCPDTRNSKVADILNELREYGIEPVIADPEADSQEAKQLYGVEFVDLSEIKDMDAVILAVAHDAFAKFTMQDIDAMFGDGKKVLLDIKGVLDRKAYENAGYNYWRL